jgi:hypothetical protein
MASYPMLTPTKSLLQIAGDLVSDLGGHWDPHRGQGLCRCPAHADTTPSLSVRIGAKALLFHCFAGCSNREIIQALRVHRPAALSTGAPGGQVGTAADGERTKVRLGQLWAQASPIEGTPAAVYLGRRKLDRGSDALRYHARVPLGPRNAVIFRPAMLAAVHEGALLVALQRTFLDADRGRRARDLDHPRRMLGRPGRGAVRLAPACDLLGLAEGVESALSAMVLLGFPVWATLGNERLARVDIPLSVRRLVLLPDNDHAGRLAMKAAMIAHAAPGRTIEVEWPWYGLNDWNDVLRAGGEEVGNRVRCAT